MQVVGPSVGLPLYCVLHDVYVCVCVCVCERERERERERVLAVLFIHDVVMVIKLRSQSMVWKTETAPSGG